MDEQIIGSYKVVEDLSDTIIKCVKDISKLNDSLYSYLNTLGDSFRDEGFSIISDYVVKSSSKISEYSDDFDLVAAKLIDYAYYLWLAEQEILRRRGLL